MRLLNLVLAACLSTVAQAQDLSWQELARRPELWPAQCTVKVAMDFQGGRSVRAGQKVNVVQVKAGDVDLATSDGRLNFAADPDETDVLELARAAYDQLTPKQRALTYAAIASDPGLWPHEVALTRGFELGGGKALRAGDRFRVLKVEAGKLSVLSETMNTSFDVVPHATDVMAQARSFVEGENGTAKIVTRERAAAEKLRAQGPILAGLEGHPISPITGQPQPIASGAQPRYIVFFRGSSTCAITRKLLPGFVTFYNQMKPVHPDFEVIYLMTERLPDTARFAQASRFAWPSLPYDKTWTVPPVREAISGLLPQVIVVDRAGTVLVEGTQNAVPEAMRRLQLLLQQAPGGR